MVSLLVTGASGFVGQPLCEELVKRGYAATAVLRASSRFDVKGCVPFRVASIDQTTDWSTALNGMDAIIHLAARVHVMKDNAADPLEEFRRINVAGTVHLARAAAAAGVKRFVFVSSIKVNGEATHGDQRFSEADIPAPQDPYGISKTEAEEALRQIAAETGLQVVVIRLPLVYGPGVKGNFLAMLKVLAKGIPLPLSSVSNQRSVIGVANLVDALIACATHPAAAGQTYLVSDGDDVSTPDLLRQLGTAVGHPARLLPCPPVLLKVFGAATGKSAQVGRLLGSLRVCDDKIRRELNWVPPCTLRQGLEATAMWYKTRNP